MLRLHRCKMQIITNIYKIDHEPGLYKSIVMEHRKIQVRLYRKSNRNASAANDVLKNVHCSGAPIDFLYKI